MNSNQNNVNNNELRTNELVASNNNIGAGIEENKEYQNDNQENEVIDEEELKNYLYNDDQNTDEIILSDLATKIAEALGM